MKTITNKKLLSVSLLVLILSSCGLDNKESQETTFYKKEAVNQKKLELSIEASGIIEAISSVEIKSKASGEILLLGAEVGDLVKKGSILGQIDQRTPKNILDQAKSDLEASRVRLENANLNMIVAKSFITMEVFQIKIMKIFRKVMLKQNLV
jgi:multidrug efflux pump subunit AcrA (membrane-fusion protein)